MNTSTSRSQRRYQTSEERRTVSIQELAALRTLARALDGGNLETETAVPGQPSSETGPNSESNPFSVLASLVAESLISQAQTDVPDQPAVLAQLDTLRTLARALDNGNLVTETAVPGQPTSETGPNSESNPLSVFLDFTLLTSLVAESLTAQAQTDVPDQPAVLAQTVYSNKINNALQALDKLHNVFSQNTALNKQEQDQCLNTVNKAITKYLNIGEVTSLLSKVTELKNKAKYSGSSILQ